MIYWIACWLGLLWTLRTFIVTWVFKVIVETAIHDEANKGGMFLRPQDVRMPLPLLVLELLRNLLFPFWTPRRFGNGVTVISSGILWPRIRPLVDCHELERIPYQVFVVKLSRYSPIHANRYVFMYEDALRIGSPK